MVVRVVSLHSDVLLATSAIWQTNCAIVRAGGGQDLGDLGQGPAEEVFVLDSPVLPEELEALPALLVQAGWHEPDGLLVTHGDWDHLLARLAFPEAALGCAASTAQRLSAKPGAAQRDLRAFDEQFYLQRPRPLMLGSIQALAVPGRCEIGPREIQLYPADGHTEDGMAMWLDWAKTLVVGDYLSTVEPPKVGGSPAAYLATLERLRPLVALAEHVVPGHGPMLDGRRALEVLEENRAFVACV
jgi:glyoxylase-like metal-dependent hydrolase (beta-lactamase superfamily II)